MNAAGATPGRPNWNEGDPAPAAGQPSRGLDRLTPLRELQLVEAWRGGDPEAVSELVQGYHRRIYAVCYRMVRDVEQASDLAQESIVKVLEGLGSYDGRSKLSTWVIRVTMNCCLSHLRKEKIRRHGSLDEGSAGADDTDWEPGNGVFRGGGAPETGELSAPDRVEHEEMLASLLQALGRLDPDMRAVLVLRDMQDLEYQQISQVLDVPVGTVKSRLFRARAALREAVEIGVESRRRPEADH